ncbi:MAG TPA: hypothetical protein VNB49_19050 [Candidatus Dormibacteraeota bacterium]|nr:hypothetical protein [Candidatus Dormibacteraeota bacterium]
MRAEIRTIVSFKSTAFNITQPKSYFINSCCFGHDVAKWLIHQLHDKGVEADSEPGQEDFGWYFNFQVADTPHTFVIGHSPGLVEGSEGTWIGWIERYRGLVGSLFGGRTGGINPAAAQALHSILSSSPQIQDIRWHFRRDFDKGREQLGAPAP